MFLWNSCSFDDPTDVHNLISGSSALSKSTLNTWKFTVHILLKPGLQNFEHYFASTKGKEEMERHNHLNVEFQRIARRDTKDFLSDQCKEIEENNTMGMIRGLFKKIRDTKGTFHAKTGTIEDRNGMDLTEAEDTKKRWQEYTEELYKKVLHDPGNQDGVITHLESDILKCKVK